MEDKDKSLGDKTPQGAPSGALPGGLKLDITSGNVTNDDGSPFMGPVDKSGVTSSLGLQGAQRFQWVTEKGHPAGMELNTPDYDTWLLSLPEDLNDLEYTRQLRAAKGNAQARQRLRSQQGNKPMQRATDKSVPYGVVGEGKIKGLASDRKVVGYTVAGQPIYDAPPNGARPPNENQSASQTAKQVKADSAAYKQAQSGKPMVFGMKIDPTEPGFGIGGPAAPGTPPDPYVAQWLQGNELNPDRDNTQIVVGSGQWVYTGEEQDPSGPNGFTRPAYQYVDDAESIITGLPQAKIKDYQHKLGIPETGVVGPDLQGLWHDAVTQAQIYAKQGVRMTLQFIFDSLVSSEIAKKKAAAGGAGGQWAEETGEDLAGADYYMAMMQVLGDISGVGSGEA